ncbi:polysaccharide deacetylase family protein [Cohnella sp. AR92]|uniref:polysaccharide deacetylase family protein n=1 Tax=Cohnella sp. AR92 TaxID=648716 RepID=UPI000F8EC0DB|nr:polysaccharide deacetylase family protein [Cohnella sp. AR92]RUS48144.1 polysaccharide deacetylase family protein [Cohnella sp. AR92]
MNRFAAAAAVPLFLLSLSACGSSDNQAAPEPTATSAALETRASSPAASAEASTQPISTPEPSASAEFVHAATDPTVPLYQMNKNYDIVPIDKEKTDRKVVLLTFDDGPKDEATLTPILDTLDKHNAKAIFFVNGYRVKEHPELLKALVERGQTIGNHSWDHIKLGKESAETIEKQIGDVQNLVKELTGSEPVFFRPPHASGNDDTHRIAKEHGLLYMTWSDGSLDWEMTGDKIKDKTSAIIKNVTDQLHSGSNILMHELPWTGEALDSLLSTLESKGYSFVDPALIDTSVQP